MCCPLAEKGVAVVLVAPEQVQESPVQMSAWNPVIAKARRVKRIPLALRAALREDADVYHFHDPELIFLGLTLKLLKPAAAVVYDVHEDYPSMMLVKHWLPKPLRPIISLAARLANKGSGLCLDGIVTADPSVQREFQAVAGNKSIVYYNFPTTYLFNQNQGELPQPEADLVYIGGMSARSGIFVLLDALSTLLRQGIRPTVRLAGYTDGEEGLRAIREGIENRGLNGQVELSGRIPHSQVPAWIRSGRIGLVTLPPIAKFMKNIPSKIFEYWACGLPVIASDLPPIRQFLSHRENGLLFDSSSSIDLARNIRWLMERPDQGKEMGLRGSHQVYTSWNNDRQNDTLISFYKSICNK